MDCQGCLRVGDIRSTYSFDELQAGEETRCKSNISVDDLWKAYANVPDILKCGESNDDADNDTFPEHHEILRYLAGQQLVMKENRSRKANNQSGQLTENKSAIILQACVRRFVARTLRRREKSGEKVGHMINEVVKEKMSRCHNSRRYLSPSPRTEENMLSDHISHDNMRNNRVQAENSPSYTQNTSYSSSHHGCKGFSHVICGLDTVEPKNGDSDDQLNISSAFVGECLSISDLSCTNGICFPLNEEGK